MKKISLVILSFIVVVGFFSYFQKDKIVEKATEPTESVVLEDGIVKEEIVKEVKVELEQVKPKPVKSPEVVVQNLTIPWELEFLPGGDMLVTERVGRLLRIGNDKKVIEISGVVHEGEGGLLGLALHPKFKDNNFIYIYMTTTKGGGLSNRVERYVLNGTTLSLRKVIVENIPGSHIHDGGRIAFGPDGMLYITTGDAGNVNNSQDKNSLAGKILRVTADGAIPGDNPFNTPVYSYGHRNPQGIAWDGLGQLWATEHGRSGATSGMDEVNKIEKGGNYGWPDIEGDESATGMISPQFHSGPSVTWAPSGMDILNDRIIFVGLRGQSVYIATISDGTVKNFKSYFKETYGRLRTVVLGPDGMLYILTNNMDGYGKPKFTDDRIIRVDPKTIVF